MYTTCRVGILLSEISKPLKISPPPSLEPLNFLAHGIIIGRVRYTIVYPLDEACCGGIYWNAVLGIQSDNVHNPGRSWNQLLHQGN